MSIFNFLFARHEIEAEEKRKEEEERYPEINAEYRMIPSDPFANIIDIRVIDMKAGYVQYIFLPETETSKSMPASNRLKDFNRMYKLVKRA